jgi:hypothetical protein
MRSIPLILISILSVLLDVTPVHAQQLSEEEQYKLCADAPTNAQCSGYEVPIVLDDHPGEAGACVMVVNTVQSQTVCKLVVTDNRVTVYYEVGEKLRFLGKRKATREIQLKPSEIKAIQYQENFKDNTTARVINTVLFGLSGLLTGDKKVSDIAIDYAPSTSISAATDEPAVAVTAPTATDQIKITVRRKTGRNLRQQLEQLTGIQAATPTQSEEKPPQPESEPEQERN